MFKIQVEPIISETQPGARITFAGVHVDVPMNVMRDIRDWWISRVDDLDEFFRRAHVGPIGPKHPSAIPAGMNGPTGTQCCIPTLIAGRMMIHSEKCTAHRAYTKPKLTRLA